MRPEKTDVFFVQPFQLFNIVSFINIVIVLLNKVVKIADAVRDLFVHVDVFFGWLGKNTKKS